MGFPREAALSTFWAMTSPAATRRCFDSAGEEGEAGWENPSAITTTTITAYPALWATMQINCKQCSGDGEGLFVRMRGGESGGGEAETKIEQLKKLKWKENATLGIFNVPQVNQGVFFILGRAVCR